jgi:hypothetical protein
VSTSLVGFSRLACYSRAVLFGTRARREKVDTARGINVAGATVPFSGSIKLFGVKLDSELSLDQHVTEVVRNCNYHSHSREAVNSCIFDRC